MSDPETRALGRAAVLLLVASLARWGWASAGDELAAPVDEASAGLLHRSQLLAESEAARNRPLGPGERLDPNTASEEDLDRLPGVGPSTARALVRSREAEGAFWGPQDLTRVRGIGPAAARRLASYLDFSGGGGGTGNQRPRPKPPPPATRAPSLVDLNRASPATLETLPGIGPALALRIVAARTRRPFESVEDLDRVPGIGPATLARLRPLVAVGR